MTKHADTGTPQPDRPAFEITLSDAALAAGAARFAELRDQADPIYAAAEIFEAIARA